MSRSIFLAKLALGLAALWWASLTCLGAWIVPSLFSHAPTKAIAGNLAASLFSGQTWLTLFCGLTMLALSNSEHLRGNDWLKNSQKGLILGMLTAFLLEYWIAPKIVLRESLMLWHSLGTAMLVVQWLCASWVFFKIPVSLEADEDEKKPNQLKNDSVED